MAPQVDHIVGVLCPTCSEGLPRCRAFSANGFVIAPKGGTREAVQ